MLCFFKLWLESRRLHVCTQVVRQIKKIKNFAPAVDRYERNRPFASRDFGTLFKMNCRDVEWLANVHGVGKWYSGQGRGKNQSWLRLITRGRKLAGAFEKTKGEGPTLGAE
jgi:hypothetical protein